MEPSCVVAKFNGGEILWSVGSSPVAPLAQPNPTQPFGGCFWSIVNHTPPPPTL